MYELDCIYLFFIGVCNFVQVCAIYLFSVLYINKMYIKLLLKVTHVL